VASLIIRMVLLLEIKVGIIVGGPSVGNRG
jgi:hypothetical protein